MTAAARTVRLTVRDCVRDALADSAEADPHAIVGDVLGELDEDGVTEAARAGVAMIAVEEARRLRHHLLAPARGVSRKSRAAEAARSRPDVFMARVTIPVGDGELIYKFLGDCTRADLLAAAALRREQAAGMLAWADRYEALGRLLKGECLVRSLGVARVEAVFDA